MPGLHCPEAVGPSVLRGSGQLSCKALCVGEAGAWLLGRRLWALRVSTQRSLDG